MAAVGIDGEAHPAPMGIPRPRVIEPTAESGSGDMAKAARPERADDDMRRQPIAPALITKVLKPRAGVAPTERMTAVIAPTPITPDLKPRAVMAESGGLVIEVPAIEGLAIVTMRLAAEPIKLRCPDGDLDLGALGAEGEGRGLAGGGQGEPDERGGGDDPLHSVLPRRWRAELIVRKINRRDLSRA